MTVETLTPAVIAAAILSIVLEWFPALADWWHGLTPARRAGLNALFVAVISIVSMLGGCYWWGNACPANVWQAVLEFLLTALLAAGGNQAVHNMTKREVLLYGR